ncbi:type II secretion system F family protein [Vibrio makurazakiensis]|uniref:type II secretion system F family protein n=1 Tax=Vibrio makurazakiensis TaxID=2910250 RepID=UPI003D14159B
MEVTKKERRFPFQFSRPQIRLSVQDRIAFYEKSASMLEEGISLFLAIQQMHKIALQTNNKRKAKVYEKWAENFKKGSKLEKVFDGYVPQNELIILAVAEKTGQLLSAFKALIETAQLKQKIRDQILSAILKPVGSIAVAVGVIIFFTIKVFPVFEDAIEFNTWPSMSKFVYSLGQFLLSEGSIALLIFIVAFVIFIRHFCVKSSSSVRMSLDRVPPFSLHKKICAVYFLQSLSVLLNSGVSLVESIKIIEGNSGGWLKAKTRRMSENIRKGQPSHQIIDVGLFDLETMADVAIFLDRGNMGVNIAKISSRNEKRLDVFFKSMSANINTAMLAILASLTMIIYFSIFQLTQMIG